jgi:hypothetical protein
MQGKAPKSATNCTDAQRSDTDWPPTAAHCALCTARHGTVGAADKPLDTIGWRTVEWRGTLYRQSSQLRPQPTYHIEEVPRLVQERAHVEPQRA